MLGMANRADVRNRQFRPSGVPGAFGGAVAALGLDEETAVNALAFAASSACGLKTSIALPSEFADAYPTRQPAAVKINLRDGRVLDGGLDDIAWLSWEGVRARSRVEAARVFDKKSLAEIEEMAFSIDALADASEFAGTLKQATPSCSS